MASLNMVQLIGRLGADVDLRYSRDGQAVAIISMATDESYNDSTGNRVQKTEWHRVVVYGKTAENCANFLRKGSLAYVEGKLQTRKWQDQQGNDRYTTEVKAYRIQFLDRKDKQEQPRQPNAGRQQEDVFGSGATSGSEAVDEVMF